jgi:ClpP class serine protease
MSDEQWVTYPLITQYWICGPGLEQSDCCTVASVRARRSERGTKCLAGMVRPGAVSPHVRAMRSSRLEGIVESILVFVWLLILIPFLMSWVQKRIREGKRMLAIRELEKKRGSRVITIIHRQESMSFLGIPIARYIGIEDSEQVLRAIRLTPQSMPIDILMHTPGGIVLASDQIASALRRHQGRVTVFVPHYAMSGGTMIALAAEEIVMDSNAVLGPVDPQLGDPIRGAYPAASIIAALEHPNPNRDDSTLILGDIARKAIRQVRKTIFDLVVDTMGEEKAEAFARKMSEGRWTHDYPIAMDEAKELGMPVSDRMPQEIYDLMELYPQPGQRGGAVEYIPSPYRSPRKKRE